MYPDPADWRYCDECGAQTNHTGEMHRKAIVDMEDAEGIDDHFAARHDAYKDGPDL